MRVLSSLIFVSSFLVSSVSAQQGPPPQAIALEIATGNWKAQATSAFITTGLSSVMEKLCGDGKFARSSDIAAKSELNPEATYRLLRFLATFDVCVEGDDKTFTLGPVGEVLTPNHPASVAKAVVWESGFTSATLWNDLPTFLKTNEHVSSKALGVDNLWSYMQGKPDVFGTFLEAMTGYSNEEAFFLSNEGLAPSFDLSKFDTVCDLGAAEGRLSLGLKNRFPSQKYILADLPQSVDRIDASKLPDGFSVEAIDFFNTDLPKADAYVMKHIIHDWNNKDSVTIFQKIRAANPKATVFVMEFGPMPGPNVPHLAKGFDLHMGVALGAIERTQEEYDELFQKSGMKRVATHSLAGGNYPLYVQEVTFNAEGTPANNTDDL